MSRNRIEKTVSLEIEGLCLQIDYKNIKNLYIKILRPSGQIRVSAPSKLSLNCIKTFIKSKMAWIEMHGLRLKQAPGVELPQCIDGSYHEFAGSRYRLTLVRHKTSPKLELCKGEFRLFVKAGTTLQKCQSVLDEWYRRQLGNLIPELIAKYEQPMGVSVNEFGIKKMKTRWGSCNTRAKRIWLNLELAKKSLLCLEYVVVHEMVHLLEPSHNQRFYRLMSLFMPDWKVYKAELDAVSIG